MYFLGPSLANATQVPKELFDWVREREQLYPLIRFVIDRLPVATQQDQALAQTYRRVFIKSAPDDSVSVVLFPYLEEQWGVRIVGGVNADGQMIDLQEQADIQPLPAALRAQIAGLTDEAQEIDEKRIGFPRASGEGVQARPEEMVTIA